MIYREPDWVERALGTTFAVLGSAIYGAFLLGIVFVVLAAAGAFG